MAATNRTKGTALAVTWTQSYPSTATAVTLTGIKSVKYDSGVSVKVESADGDIYPTVCFNDFNDPTFSFSTINPWCVAAFSASNRGTLFFKVADAFNGITAAGGARSYTVTDTYLVDTNIDHDYREFGKNSFTFKTISTDGTTNPVTLTAL